MRRAIINLDIPLPFFLKTAAHPRLNDFTRTSLRVTLFKLLYKDQAPIVVLPGAQASCLP
ncbi:MAG: hypothetical protein WBP93_21460 [Pyrinomonadaceae bacterium]